MVKKLRKSVNICRSYGQESSVLVFLTHGVVQFLLTDDINDVIVNENNMHAN